MQPVPTRRRTAATAKRNEVERMLMDRQLLRPRPSKAQVVSEYSDYLLRREQKVMSLASGISTLAQRNLFAAESIKRENSTGTHEIGGVNVSIGQIKNLQFFHLIRARLITVYSGVQCTLARRTRPSGRTINYRCAVVHLLIHKQHLI